ncbi:class II histocompatibility antigen, M beta 1 chain [Crotalus tigris]|uniref:class II histocompatibility antigen, M beta 1 chain n=1 Tax=Crotalus tigris TaxID=88082 RepID=UPI00192F401B|nr:class II histocompatibility antigen, M beta 1 chain [Crotalus tigris]
MPPPGLLLLILALSAPPAGAFVLHLETDCLLSADGGVLEHNWVLFFNKMPFTCYDFNQSQVLPCGLGASQPWDQMGVPVAQWLAQNAPELPQEAAQQCQIHGRPLWAQTGQRLTMPKVSIFPVTPQNTPDPIMLACVAWGFYPGDVNVTWLWNGDPVKDLLDPLLVTSNGDWTYQARLTLPVDPQKGGSYSCSVQHPSLAAPLTAEWTPGIPSELWIKIGVSVAVLVVGTVFLASGLVFWKRSRLQGYVPLEGDSYPSEGR